MLKLIATQVLVVPPGEAYTCKIVQGAVIFLPIGWLGHGIVY